MNTVTSLENQVMEMLLAGDEDILATLRHQYRQSQVLSRKMTGVGFYTDFSVPPGAPRLTDKRRFRLGDVNGKAANIENGVGFVLHVVDGALATLEGYTYDEPWPEAIHDLTLTYSTGIQNRDVRKLKDLLHNK
jgi:hypothetical protein